MELATIARSLYRLTPAEFTAVRNSHARELSAQGDRSLAQQVRALPKPPAAAWALNQLATEDKTARDKFERLGSDLRAAQRDSNRTRLTELVAARKKLVARSTETVTDVAKRGGVALSDSSLQDIRQSLIAALTDPGGLEAVFSGRLVRPIQSDGLEPIDLRDAVGGPPLALPKRRTKKETPGKAASVRMRADIERAIKQVAHADERVASVDKELARVEDERRKIADEIRALQSQFNALQAREQSIDREAESLQRGRVSAADRAQKARSALDDLRQSK